MVYKFRVILDNEEDIFRDIAILEDDNLEDFHNAIFNSFGFDGMEVGSFYTCDDTWNQQDEIPLFDTGDTLGEMKIMSDYKLSDILDAENTKIIYVYDFINMWTFLVELASIEDQVIGNTYPETIFVHGEMPDYANENNFEADMNSDQYNDDFEDDYDEEDMDMFNDDTENFEDFGFEENWN